MSENVHSLPPDIKGKAHGKLGIEIGNIIWIDNGITPQSIHFRVKFWGEKGPGVILRSKSTRNDLASNEIEYTVRCTQPIFINYLMDMGSLTIDVTDNQWRLLGAIKINIKLYLKRDSSASKGNLASNFGFSNIDAQGIFPILTSSDPPKKLGEVELFIYSDFGNPIGNVSKIIQADVPRPNYVEKYSENAKVYDNRVPNSFLSEDAKGYDNRVANSLLPDGSPGDYNLHKIVSFKEEKEAQETYKPDKQVKSNKIEFEYSELPKEDLRTDINMSIEWENLRLKGEKLRKKLEASSKPEIPAYATENIPLAKDPDSPLPTISELQALTFPYDPTELPRKPIPDKSISELNSITHLKLEISSLTLYSSRKDTNPYLDCTIPLPSSEGNRIDSFKISHKGNFEDIYQFNHESLHNILISDGVFSRLASNTIKIKVCNNEKGKVIEIGKSEVIWEKILLSQGFVYETDLEINQEEVRAKKSIQKNIGKLSVCLRLINDKQPPVNDLKVESKPENIKSYLLYLYIDHANKLQIPNLNLFLTYKTFPDQERITTEVIWDYKNLYSIGHKMQTVVTGTESISEKLSGTSLIIELWNKITVSQEELIGIVKLPLQLFSSYISSGESLANSVYPIIAFDEYRPISNVQTGEDIGYIKLCLAMGSSTQVNRLRQTHEVVIKPNTLGSSLHPDSNELQEKSLQVSENKNISDNEEALSHSIDSIGDIAMLLNQRTKKADNEEYKASQNFAAPLKTLDEPNTQEKIPEIETKPDNEFIPIKKTPLESLTPDKSIEDIILDIKSVLKSESIDLEEELKIADRFNYGYMHKESLSYFLQELRLGLQPKEVEKFIDHILSTKGSSTIRRVLFNDILATLGLIAPLYTKHTFTVTIAQIFSCNLMTRLRDSHVYLKYQFPTESNYIETDLLEPAVSIQINLKSVHSCTFPKTSSLEQCFSENIEGICVLLCRHGAMGEEKVIGKGLLPIEEVVELESTNKLNRVVCLYGDLNEDLQIFRSDLIGKVRISIEYTSNFSYQPINASSELLFEKQTQIDRKIPKKNLIAILLESYTELNRGIKYMKSIGIDINAHNHLDFHVSLFNEDKDLSIEYPEVLISTNTVKDKDTISVLKYLNVNISAKVLEYLNHNSGLLSLYFDKVLLGTCKVPLMQLLLHSNVKGEYPILNEFGQFMGIVSLTLSFSLEEFAQVKPKPLDHNPGPSIKCCICIESALNLKTEIDGESPNVYVRYTWLDGLVYNTPSVLRSTCPAWNYTNEVLMPNDEKILEKPLVFLVLHKSNRGDVAIGEAVVDLSMISSVKSIDGWYHILSNNHQVGQLKIKISCDDNFHTKFNGKVKSEVFYRLPSPQVIEKATFVTQKVENKFEERLKLYGETLENDEDNDILAKHYDNMKAIENLSKNLEMKLNGTIKPSSPLRKNSLFKRFVPINICSETSPVRNSYPLRQTRETSPLKGSGIEIPSYNSFPLRKSRENSPPKDHHYTGYDSFPLRKSRESSPPKDYNYTGYDSFPLRKSRETSPPRDYTYAGYQKPSQEFRMPDVIKYNYDYKEEFPTFERNPEEEDEWNQDRIADVLKTIEEASKFGEVEETTDNYDIKPYNQRAVPAEYHENFYRMPNPVEINRSYEPISKITNNYIQDLPGIEDIKNPTYINSYSEPEKAQDQEKFNRKRTSPKITRSALPKSLLSDPEISRIAAIMKGSK
jgi:C2 domain